MPAVLDGSGESVMCLALSPRCAFMRGCSAHSRQNCNIISAVLL